MDDRTTAAWWLGRAAAHTARAAATRALGRGLSTWAETRGELLEEAGCRADLATAAYAHAWAAGPGLCEAYAAGRAGERP